MNITKETIKSTLRSIMAEESEYQTFFKKALEKSGKSIPSMSDEEKKESSLTKLMRRGTLKVRRMKETLSELQ